MLVISEQCEPRFQTTVSGCIFLGFLYDVSFCYFCCFGLVGPFKSSEALGGPMTIDHIAHSAERSRRFMATNAK